MFRYVCGRALYGVLITISLALIGCAKQESASSVPNAVGTYAAETTGYGAVVMIKLPTGGICSGSIVGEFAVLFAAHCAEKSGRFAVTINGVEHSTYTKFDTGCYGVDCPNDVALLVFTAKIAVRGTDPIYRIADKVSQGDILRLVGFGCKSLKTRKGAGKKRTGTNEASEVDEYITFRTPVSSADDRTGFSRNIIGDAAQAGSCFGDSGGPALVEPAGGATGQELELSVAGVTHAGGKSGDVYISEYVDVANQSDQRRWLSRINQEQGLGIVGL